MTRRMRRTCGRCTACCKTHAVSAVGTIAGTWCNYCAVGRGCTIYDRRPYVCAVFSCEWLRGFGTAHMRPDRSGFVIDNVRSADNDLMLGVPRRMYRFWEYERGALEKRLVANLRNRLLRQGHLVAYFYDLPKVRLFLPTGIEPTPAIMHARDNFEWEVITG